MLKNYLKITFRNIVRNKLFTTINILGLSVSIASCLLLFLYVSEQLSYDKHHDGKIYRITSKFIQNTGAEFEIACSSIPVAPAIQQEIPEIIEATRFIAPGFTGSKDMITLGTESFYITNGAVADSNFFKVLNYDIIEGYSDNLLANGNSIVLEKEWAEKLFGKESALGQTVKLSTLVGVDQFEVTGVYDKKTYNTHFAPTFVISNSNAGWKGFFDQFTAQWVGNNLAFTYIKVNNEASVKDIEQKIGVIFKRNGAEEMKSMGANKIMSLQSVDDIHTTTGLMGESSEVISLTFIYVLMSIGVLILLLACVNYVNLSTAQAGNRALEVGVRKVMGISSRGLILQFLGESFIIVFISLLASVLLAEVTIPIFNIFVDQPIDLTTKNIGQVVLYLIGFLFFTAFVAGSYPAFYLASFKPTAVLKGRNKDRGGVALLRKTLVTFQFIISIVLISSILIISEQVSFIKNKDLGFDATSKIVVPLSSNEDQSKFELIKKEFGQLAGINSVSGAAVVPGMNIVNDLLVYKKGQTMDDAIHIYNNNVDINYIKTLGIDLLAGRDFLESDMLDTLAGRILINRKAMIDLGFDLNTAENQSVFMDWGGRNIEFKIMGVIEDINQFSLHQSIEPLMLSLGERSFSKVIIDANIDNYSNTISNIKTVFKEVLPETPFESFALNDHLVGQYESDFKTFNLVIYFAFISVFISCMGLYALSMFTAERRFKEIGVRKALGASIKDIIVLVSKDLSLIVLVAFIISVPLSIYGMNMWLDSFAYKITPGITTYIIAGGISIAIGWLTISYQSIRAARTNPVDVLKDE
jgi:putative ABC transport system permease protein